MTQAQIAWYRQNQMRQSLLHAVYMQMAAAAGGSSQEPTPPAPPTPPVPPTNDKLKLVVETTSDYKKSGIYSAERDDASKPIVIDWGDGTVERVNGDVNQLVHEYTSVGVFNVVVENIKSYAASSDNFSWKNTSQNQYTLKKVVAMPDSVANIGDSAFRSCINLTSVTIPDGVASIGNYAFYNCNGLTDVTIGSGVASIGYSAFDDCSSLTSFTVDDGNANYKSVNGLLLSKDGTTLIKGVNGDVTIPESVTSIEQCAFYGCSSLENLSFAGDNVPAGGFQCFYDIADLTDVYMLNISQSEVMSQLDGNIKDWGFGICHIDGKTTYYAVTIHCKDDEIVTIDPTPSGSGS